MARPFRRTPRTITELGSCMEIACVGQTFTQAALGRNGDARVTLESVLQRYPGTEAAQLATERLKRLPANAR